MAKIGYARVSTLDQDTTIQKTALLAVGCDRVITEKASGAKVRPKLELLLKSLKKDDVLVVHKLDRLARSMTHFVRVFDDLKLRGIRFKSLSENIETETAQGRMFLHLLAAFAELERELIRERCLAGQLAARARGQRWGLQPAFNEVEAGQLTELWHSGYFKQKELSIWFSVSVATICDTIHRHERRGRYATNKLHK